MDHMTRNRRDELVEAVFEVVTARTAGPHAAMPPHSAGCCYGVGLYDAAVAAVAAVLADLEIDVVDGSFEKDAVAMGGNRPSGTYDVMTGVYNPPPGTVQVPALCVHSDGYEHPAGYEATLPCHIEPTTEELEAFRQLRAGSA